MARRAKANWGRIDDLLVSMDHDVLAPLEKVRALSLGLAHFHKNDDFRSCTGMGELVRKNLEVSLGLVGS